MSRIHKFAVIVAGLVILMPLARQRAALHLHLLRTDDYDSHRFEYLDGFVGEKLRGKTVLSDPTTSYYARGMAGAYIMAVHAGHASPAVDHSKRHELAWRALRNGPDRLQAKDIDVVLIDKRNGSTAGFVGVAATAIKEKWLAGGWRVAAETVDAVVLTPGDQGAIE